MSEHDKAHLQATELGERSAPLVGNVVDHQHAPRIRHLAIVAVVRLVQEASERHICHITHCLDGTKGPA